MRTPVSYCILMATAILLLVSVPARAQSSEDGRWPELTKDGPSVTGCDSVDPSQDYVKYAACTTADATKKKLDQDSGYTLSGDPDKDQ